MDEPDVAAPARSTLANLFDRALDLGRGASGLLFPPSCPGCGRMLAAHSALCSDCWQQISFIERPYCEVLGTPFTYDLGPGILSPEAIADPPVFDRLRSVCQFDGVARKLVHALKYNDRTELAPMMAGWLARAGSELVAACDVIVPVPLHHYRLLSRRFNQAAELARELGKRAEKPFDPGLVRRNRRTRQQVGLKRTQREANMRGAFTVTERGRGEVFGKRVLLVDDVYTTGATVSAIARALKAAGAVDVSVLTFARAIASHGVSTI
jgi:ComF family protein